MFAFLTGAELTVTSSWSSHQPAMNDDPRSEPETIAQQPARQASSGVTGEPETVAPETARQAGPGAFGEPETIVHGTVRQGDIGAPAEPDTLALETVRQAFARAAEAAHVTLSGHETALPAHAPRGDRGRPPMLGRYTVKGVLGRGGMGEVLRVRDAELGRSMAAKVIRGQVDASPLHKFVLEAKLTGQLEHPGVVSHAP